MAAKKEYEQQCDESPEEVADRLSRQHQQQEAARKAQEERYYQQFSFKPAINPRSQQLAEVQPC